MAPLRDITWKHVVVIVTFLVVLAAMLAAGNEVAIFLAVGMAVLAGIGVVAAQQASNNKETQVVREQTNGTQTALVAMLVEQGRRAQETNGQLVAILDGQAKLLAQMHLPPELIGSLHLGVPGMIAAGPATDEEPPTQLAA